MGVILLAKKEHSISTTWINIPETWQTQSAENMEEEGDMEDVIHSAFFINVTKISCPISQNES